MPPCLTISVVLNLWHMNKHFLPPSIHIDKIKSTLNPTPQNQQIYINILVKNIISAHVTSTASWGTWECVQPASRHWQVGGCVRIQDGERGTGDTSRELCGSALQRSFRQSLFRKLWWPYAQNTHWLNFFLNIHTVQSSAQITWKYKDEHNTEYCLYFVSQCL